MRFDEINCFCFQNAHSSYLRTCALYSWYLLVVPLLMFRIVILVAYCMSYSVCLSITHQLNHLLLKMHQKMDNFSVDKMCVPCGVQLIKMKRVCMKLCKRKMPAKRQPKVTNRAKKTSCWDLCVYFSGKLLNHVLISFETNFFPGKQ